MNDLPLGVPDLFIGQRAIRPAEVHLSTERSSNAATGPDRII
jgi:hypothetical protein